MTQTTLPNNQELIDFAKACVQNDCVSVGSAIYVYFDGTDLEGNPTYIAEEPKPRPNEECNEWIEILDTVILSAELVERFDIESSYVVKVNTKITTRIYDVEDGFCDEIDIVDFFVNIFQDNNQLCVHFVEY